jgi:erythromycin esterase
MHLWAQTPVGEYKLNGLDSLLTPDVKAVLDKDISEKRIVFLGESEHHIGSDLLAKTEFVKYLVLQHGYRDIAFEGDFFALYFEHSKQNLFPMWSRTEQCKNLFEFLQQHGVTIWGFDNQFSSGYSFKYFSPKLFEFLNDNHILWTKAFREEVDVVMASGPEVDRKLQSKQMVHLLNEIDALLQNPIVHEDRPWFQILESFKSTVRQCTSKRTEGIAIRDHQMASNLNFITSLQHDKKFIVWAANGHISKLNLPDMKGQTMGFQYVQLNPNTTYHIAFAPIKMPYRNDKFIESQKKDPDNLLNLLPSVSDNYFIATSLFSKSNPSLTEKDFDGMFGLTNEKTKYFQHYDALVFIANGEKSKYIE